MKYISFMAFVVVASFTYANEYPRGDMSVILPRANAQRYIETVPDKSDSKVAKAPLRKNYAESYLSVFVKFNESNSAVVNLDIKRSLSYIYSSALNSNEIIKISYNPDEPIDYFRAEAIKSELATVGVPLLQMVLVPSQSGVRAGEVQVECCRP